MKLDWKGERFSQDASLGFFDREDGVRFNLMFLATNYRRGQWRLLVEIASHDYKWGCFDDQDQPMRYYFSEEVAKSEAQIIADILVADHDHNRARGRA